MSLDRCNRAVLVVLTVIALVSTSSAPSVAAQQSQTLAECETACGPQQHVGGRQPLWWSVEDDHHIPHNAPRGRRIWIGADVSGGGKAKARAIRQGSSVQYSRGRGR